MKLSPNYLYDIAIQSLNLAADGIRKDTCDVVSNEFGYTIEERHNISVETVYAPVDGSKHFVSILPAKEVSGCPNQGVVIVDATIKQFQDNFDITLPEVLILNPNEDWTKYYDSVNTDPIKSN